MTYVDGFVIPIKKSKLSAYKKMASDAGKIWMKHGARQYMECVGEELKVSMPTKKENPFGKKFKLKPSETILFSWIVYKSKAHRNSVNAKVMKVMSEKYQDHSMKDMPFDMKKVLYAGFKPIVQMGK